MSASLHHLSSAPGTADPETHEAPVEDLAALEFTLKAAIDDCLRDTRSALRHMVSTAITGRRGAPGPPQRRDSEVARTLKLRGARAAEILLLLVDNPDVHHNYFAIAGALAEGGQVSEKAKNIIRVSISGIRQQLKAMGVDHVIHNTSGRGYLVTAQDAARIKALWAETTD